MLTILAILAATPTTLETLLPNTASGPGCVVDVRRDGKIIVARSTGLSNLETPTPNKADTVFEIGSVSKQFIGAGVALLADRGKLGLDDGIRRWLPELPSLYDRVTIRMLVNHTSGIRSWNNLAELTGNGEDGTGYDNGWVLRAVAKQRRLNNTPGAEYLYSNSNFVLAAIIIERVSGETLNAFFAHNLFDRLGMRQTQWRTNFRAIVPQRAQGYTLADDGTWQWDMPFNDVAGAGGLMSTVGDLQRWNAALADPSSSDARWISLIQQPGRLNDGLAIKYGFGLELDPIAGQPAVSHAGSTASYRAWLGRIPRQGLSIALLCNSGAVNTEELGPKTAALYLPATPEAQTDKPTLLAPIGLDGVYRNAANDAPVTVASDQYGLHFNGGIGFREVAPGQLVSADGRRTATVRRSKDAAILIELTRLGNAPTVLISTTVWQPSRNQMDRLTGRYASPEIDGVQEIGSSANGLEWRDPAGARHPLKPLYLGAFEAEGTGWTLRWSDPSGNSRKLSFSITRARRIEFSRTR